MWSRRKHARGQVPPNAGEVLRCCYAPKLWGDDQQERFILEALVCGAHLQTHCVAKRIMFVCEDMIDNPAVNLLKFIWEVHACDHLQASSHMQKMSHKRLRKV
jgi:hypothetical protein